MSIFLGGDAIIIQPWSMTEDPAFAAVVAEMRAADATIVNLETVIHEHRGFAQPECGGICMASPPEIAQELRWAGVDIAAGANNHSFDYGSEGVLETLDHVAAAGIGLAGIGRDLQAARAPVVFDSEAGSVGLVSMASTYIPYGRASNSRSDMPGRPGLNPLSLTPKILATVTKRTASRLARWKIVAGARRKPARGDILGFFRWRILVGDRSALNLHERAASEGDLRANLDAIADAASKADLTVASIHAHRQDAWLRKFAHQAIDRGADVVFVQGPHEVRAIEFHAGKPIFYSLGDFVFQPHRVSRFPSEMYDMFGLGPDATVEELRTKLESGTRLSRNRKTFEGVAAVLDFRDRKIERIRLLPLDLQFAAPPEIRGLPRMADAELGRKIVAEIADLSRKHGTVVRYDAASNEGQVELPLAHGTTPIS
ncbi:MAG: CapA family protein [Hyphomicrobiales bacterium]|nr:CapA family protein [Hyphomicrobiales bacterium]